MQQNHYTKIKMTTGEYLHNMYYNFTKT